MHGHTSCTNFLLNTLIIANHLEQSFEEKKHYYNAALMIGGLSQIQNLLSLFRVKCCTRNWLQRAMFDCEAFQNFQGPCESFNSRTDNKCNRMLINYHLPAGSIESIVFKVDVKLQITTNKEEPKTQCLLFFECYDWRLI